MERRRVLEGIGTGLALALTGCTGERLTDGTATPSPSEPATAPPDRDPIARHGVPETICSAELKTDFSIRAIVEPAFAAGWAAHDVASKYRVDETGPGLADRATVVGVTAGDRARAYPLVVLWWHEIVNDAFGGPVLVTFCPICRSGMVAERTVAGTPTPFGVSGQLWRPPGVYYDESARTNVTFGAHVEERDGSVLTDMRNSGNLVMVDRATGSYWSQVLARAICGPQSGTSLSLRPYEVTTWASWKRAHPETDVLLPPPHSTLMAVGEMEGWR